MKKNKIYLLSIAFSMLALATSCDSFLDKLPDDRAEVNTDDKVTSLLVSAYPTVAANVILEASSDNLIDNGEQYSTTKLIEDAYRFRTITPENNDTPKNLWNNYYKAIASANQVLASIEEMGNPESLKAQRAEALMCRAYGMFSLANVFCMAYNPEKADEYMGLPYPLKPETTVNPDYERGTLKQLYENINKDIEEALPNISDDIYTQPKYHFNQKAAYAFAARFNLYYMNYDKVIEYATKVLGTNPSAMLRTWAPLMDYSNSDDICNAYMKSSEKANLLLQPIYTIAGRYLQAGAGYRFAHNNSNINTYETYRANMPWGGSYNHTTLIPSRLMYGMAQLVFVPKLLEQFEYTDKVNGTGYPHIVVTAFTADETLLCRAEAYALKGDKANAIADINTWIASHTTEVSNDGQVTRPVMTEESINSFYNGLEYEPVRITSNAVRSVRKKLNPQGFTVAAGSQENIIELILQMRRIETCFEGLRFQDLKRYGIEYEHIIDGESPVTFKAGDLRGAIQLPNDVLEAGLPANPREESNN